MSLNVKDTEDLESDVLIDSSSRKNDSKIDNQQTESQAPRPQFKHSLKNKMYILFRELYFLILIVLTYAAFQNSTPKVSKIPKAYPFFPKGSLVKDYYNGDLSEAIEFASQSDVAFVMYYAPWDAESQHVRNEFNLAAQHFSSHIHFVAINCWQPNSECRQQYSKVYSWPVLMAYPVHGRGIQYRGIKRHEYMIRFLQLVANPIKRISTLAEISQYRNIHDAVVLGLTDAKLGSSDFGVFYSAALRLLERDPFRDVQFLVYTATHLVEYIYRPTIHLYLWNETLMYPDDNEWKPDVINNWISENLHQVSLWATLPGSKSTTLSSYLSSGPALILFTPRNPLYTFIDYYVVLHGVALDYYNCDHVFGMSMIKDYFELMRSIKFREYKSLEEQCLQMNEIKKQHFPTVITYDINKIWTNNSCSDKKQPMRNFCYGKKNKNTCSNVVITPNIRFNEQLLYSAEFDIKSPENLIKLYEKQKCDNFRLANKLHPGIFAPYNISEDKSVNITGLACKTNMTMSMLALDSFEYHHLAENLGVDILNKADKTAAIIVNPKFETHHVMENSFSRQNLEEFIFKFTYRKLNREISSQIETRKYSHVYISNGSNLYKDTNQKMHLIQELTTSNFLSTVLQSNTAVIVMYYSTKCSFCTGVSHILLECCKKLSDVKQLQFARIDGDSQGLPWEYSMHHFPSVLYFPPKRKSESRVFPQSVPFTVPNLLAFILANVEPNMKLKIMWTICNQTKFPDEMQKCIKTVKNESMSLIGKMLRLYRLNMDIKIRTFLLKQLQNIRSLYFALSANYINNKQISKYMNALRDVDVVNQMIK